MHYLHAAVTLHQPGMGLVKVARVANGKLLVLSLIHVYVCLLLVVDSGKRTCSVLA